MDNKEFSTLVADAVMGAIQGYRVLSAQEYDDLVQKGGTTSTSERNMAELVDLIKVADIGPADAGYRKIKQFLVGKRYIPG